MEERLTLRNLKFKMTPTRKVLMVFAALFVIVALYRFLVSLGAATNLTDMWPWGLWIFIDVKLGVALAAGGFTTCFFVYVMGKKYRPIARPAVLTAWLGYILVCVGLMFDLGRWYNFWRPIFFWGIHSVMFELYWCVLMYTIVLTCEFGPVLCAGLGWNKLRKLLSALTIPFVILGILLSTMHQSSLGSLYILMVDKLNPVWWSILLPIFYFLTAAAVGPAMVTVESYISAKAYGRNFEHELDILQSVGKFTGVMLFIYFVLKMVDLAYRHQFARVFNGSLESNMFLLEIIAGVIIPVIIYGNPKLRKTTKGIMTAASLTVFGVILNRFDVVFTGMAKSVGVGYFPTWMEFAVTIGLISIAVLAYCFVVENFEVFPLVHQKTVPSGAQTARGIPSKV